MEQLVLHTVAWKIMTFRLCDPVEAPGMTGWFPQRFQLLEYQWREGRFDPCHTNQLPARASPLLFMTEATPLPPTSISQGLATAAAVKKVIASDQTLY